MKARVCELCSREAFLYCASDSAFLCFDCDVRVHGANFLVARHIRQSICSKCKDLSENLVTGGDVVFRHLLPVCRACSAGEVSDSSMSSESSACISTTESFICSAKKVGGFDRRRRRSKLEERIASSSSVTDISGEVSNTPSRFSGEVTSANIPVQNNKVVKSEKWTIKPRTQTTSVDAKGEGIFANWCTRMGLNCNFMVVSLASKALRFCLGRTGVLLPSKVMLAASFWLGLKFYGNRSMSTCQSLRRLEEVSGVPAKLILTVGMKIARDLRARKGRRDLEEGSAECSV
ncbi:B-box zinc finger protein 32 [Ziziphus jujuba]|uniref:B-box zinc finger protein 32 n=1 Tax=Ziziphus jujuba TaxID=326968 RepID=A0A6P4AFJ6_ZIZJJ|nr:B-box zinc finger protein 32 [Ziziphus jujuba]